MPPSGKPYQTISLLDFQKRFPTDQACWDYLVKRRWPRGYRCPEHPQAKVHFKPSARTFQCYRCDRQASVSSGTIFHKSRLPLRKWFWAIFLMGTTPKGVSMRYLQKELGIASYRAVWMLGHKIRQAMVHREGLYRLRGNVQVDEMKLGRQSLEDRRRRRQDRHTRFLMGVQEGEARDYPRFVTFEQLESSFKEDVLPAIVRRIARGSRLKSDAAGVFKQAESRGYRVDQVSFARKREKAKEHLKGVYWVSSNTKRGLASTYHGCYPKYRKAYLAEFAYRFNRRYWPHQAFDRLLYACLNRPPITLRQLKA